MSCRNVVEEYHYFDFEGSRINYKNSGKGESNILFIHGWGCDLNAWKFQEEYFKDKANLILVDLPGYGKSSKESIQYSIDYFAKSLLALISKLEIQEVHIVGHSLGHPIAKKMAEFNPNIVKSLCIVDGVYFDFPEAHNDKELYKKELDGFVSMFDGEERENNIKLFVNSLHIESTLLSVRSYTDSIMLSVPIYVGLNTMEHLVNENNWDKRKIDMPTLAVYANIPELPDNNDSILRSWYPQLEYHELDNTGHFLMMEKPDEFNFLLNSFIRNL